MDTHFDCLVIGAGYAGSVAAREMAERGGRRVLVLERRGHVGGNAYDCLDEHGILIHKYGPHIFHTSERRVFDYLSRFTGWRDYQHRVVANVHGRFLPVPFNLASLHMAFPKEKAARLEDKLLSAYSANARVTILSLRENTDPELREVADYVYENVFVHYTMKQWGQTPEEIDPATTARVPVLLSRDDRYFQDPYQGMPLEGYTPLFQRMLDHLRITVELGVDARERMALEDGVIRLDGEPFAGPVIYTGEVDELFSFRFGHLPYRTLDFDFETLEVDRFQPTATVNYTVSEDYTRITEYKQLTGQVVPGRTTIMKEYSRAYTGSPGEIPYYAVISPENNALYGRYRDLAGGFSNLHLLGRLAEYKYYNMDAIALRALTLCDGILEQ
ncbi:UDP-galactopyranose mutase [Intestinimonas butyriciproducens]|uniref:UDP-galactopyranose mutase n=1 Tax=Intestinimonas butyriciproducens TaxID=1297617 RepID=A0A2U1C1C6_9FIRM|nr:UDP-galactopyranose mutase [Intestinimonas butyriciproducens]MBU5230585.1 UDP-galactopyranose mutase [Intestinimonas butyriciproducens]MCI6362379.1 UDP-galactopyranose mutase [Intestinimonas butyriciproducens]MCR1906722.1 UDP-galactopyranose mutase [Intestinimonas butyriciproducens]MDB7830968.1 UDP-galactopyranose mutase [Intestinimonas butyriciproducens]MDY3617216.1 UDP-galactopyranose mutase [Intestinimonas butyriciproducens]